MVVFGPVPSRRLGKSLGINNIPHKTCSFSCIYCQIGRTNTIQVERVAFYDPALIFDDVRKKVEATGRRNIDYLTFVAEGEPTLDINLDRHIELLKSFGIKVAIITNSSLLWHQTVREDLMLADYVSLKVDSVHKKTWRKTDRPHQSLHLSKILQGILQFSNRFKGTLVTETMLVKGINDSEQEAGDIADFLKRIRPDIAYISIPTRPPAEDWALPPDEESINRTFQLFSDRLQQVEYLIGYEGNAFACTGNIQEDLLEITSVHPMREEALSDILDRANADWSVVDSLLNRGLIKETEYSGKKFFMRTISSQQNP